MGGTRWKLLAGLLSIFSCQELFAQDSSATQKEIWPEIEVYYRVSDKIRFYGELSGTRSNSSYTDGTIGAYVDFFPFTWIKGRKFFDLNDSTMGYYWWFRAGYSYSDAPPDEKKKVVNILETETNNSFHLPAEIVLQTRNRLDWRWVNGDFQPIYRPRVKFIRNFKTAFLTFNMYLWSEYFFYLNDNSKNMLRLTAGSVIKATRFMDLEIYYLHQFPNYPSVDPLNAIGIQLDFYFKSRGYRKNLEEETKKP